MLTVLLVVQVIIAVSMIGVILIQKSSSDGLAGLSGGGGGNSLMSGRASANLLTRTTTILAVAFMLNSLAMATITSRSSSVAGTSIVDKIGLDKKETTNTENATQEQPPEEGTPEIPIAE